ncbi:MAG: ribonuclease P protein component [Deltaproteobacteria bacterium]|nr:ribonuclease P protein component [Deltaproteobacteria bacterium]
MDRAGGSTYVNLPACEMGKQSFGKDERITKRRDYLRIYKEGGRIGSGNFVVILGNNQSGKTRLGVAVSKRVGNSVTRNRIKRLIREFFRLRKDSLPGSKDIVIVAKKDISSMKCEDVCKELERLFVRGQGI